MRPLSSCFVRFFFNNAGHGINLVSCRFMATALLYACPRIILSVSVQAFDNILQWRVPPKHVRVGNDDGHPCLYQHDGGQGIIAGEEIDRFSWIHFKLVDLFFSGEIFPWYVSCWSQILQAIGLPALSIRTSFTETPYHLWFHSDRVWIRYCILPVWRACRKQTPWMIFCSLSCSFTSSYVAPVCI